MKEKGCDVEGVLLHVQSQLLCIYYIVFSLIFIREKEGRRRRRKKKPIEKCVANQEVRIFEDGASAYVFFLLDGVPITISFLLHSLFLRVLFVCTFLDYIEWDQSSERANGWVRV